MSVDSSLIGLVRFDNASTLSTLIKWGHVPETCFSHNSKLKTSEQIPSPSLVQEEKAYLKLRLLEWQASTQGKTSDSIYTENQFRIKGQLQALCEEVYSPHLNRLKVLRLVIFSYLQQVKVEMNLRITTSIKEQIEPLYNHIIESAVHLFYEIEEYISTQNEKIYDKALSASRTVSQGLLKTKTHLAKVVDSEIMEKFNKTHELWLLFDECLNDRQNLFPLLLAPLWPTPVNNPLSIKGLEFLRECAAMFMVRLQKTQNRIDVFIQKFKLSVPQLGLSSADSKNYINKLNQIQKKHKEIEQFISENIKQNPTLSQIIKILKEKQNFDLQTIGQLLHLFKERKDVLTILQTQKEEIEKLCREAHVLLNGYLEKKKKVSSISSEEKQKSHADLSSSAKDILSEFSMVKYTIFINNEAFHQLKIFWRAFILEAITYLELAQSGCREIQQYNVLKLNPSLLKSQYVSSYELFLLSAQEELSQSLIPIFTDKEISIEESEVLKNACSKLKSALSILQTNNRYQQGIISSPYLSEIFTFLNACEKSFLSINKNLSPGIKAKIKSLENLASLLILPFRFYPGAEAVNPFMLRTLSLPLGNEFELTSTLTAYFEHLLFHTKETLTFSNEIDNYYPILKAIFQQLIDKIPIHSRSTVRLRIDRLLNLSECFLQLKETILTIVSFQNKPSSGESLLKYALLLLQYRTQMHSGYSEDRFLSNDTENFVINIKKVAKDEPQEKSESSVTSTETKWSLNFEELEQELYLSFETIEKEIFSLNRPLLSWARTYSLLQQDKKIPSLKRRLEPTGVLKTLLPVSSPAKEESISHEQHIKIERPFTFAEIKNILKYLLHSFHQLQFDLENPLRNQMMKSCLDNIQSFYLVDLNELLENAEVAKEMPYTYVENIYLRSALIIEQSIKFLLLYFSKKGGSAAPDLCDWVDSKKQLRSSHNLIQLLDTLKEVIEELKIPSFLLSDSDSEAIGFFQNIIQKSSRYLEKAGTPEAVLLKQLIGLSYLRNAYLNNLLTETDTADLKIKYGSTKALWLEEMEKEIHFLIETAKNQATTSLNIIIRIFYSLFPKERKEGSFLEAHPRFVSAPLPLGLFSQTRPLLLEVKKMQEELAYVYQVSPNQCIQLRYTNFDSKRLIYREIQFSQALSEIPHYLISFQELSVEASSSMIYLKAHSLLLKVCLLLERCQMLLLSYFDIPSENNPLLHILFEEITTQSQTRIRAHSHDLKEAFKILEKTLKNKNKQWQFNDEVVKRIFSLHNFIGVIDRYPSMQGEDAAIALNKLRELSLLQTNLSDNFFTEDQLTFLNKKGPKDLWPQLIQKDIETIYEKEIYPLIEACLIASVQMLNISLSSIKED